MSKSSQKPRKATPRKKAKRLSDVIPELAVFDTEPRIAKQSTILLFDEIGAELETRTAKYKDAGEWLDSFCSDEEYRNRRKADLNACREDLEALWKESRATKKGRKAGGKKCADDRFAIASMDARGLKHRIRIQDRDRRELTKRIEKPEVSLQDRFSDAWRYLLKTYKRRKPVTVEDARRIILISWLLSEHNTETIAGKITEFALWSWKSREDWASRSYAAACFWCSSYSDRWKKLMRRALKRVGLQDQLEALKESPQGKSKAETILPIEHSLPLPMVKWACIFGVSANKLRELRREEKYHFSKVSARLWTLPKDELPTEYLEKYRQHTSHTHLKAQ